MLPAKPVLVTPRRVAALQVALVLALAATLRVPDLGVPQIDEELTIASQASGSIRRIATSWSDHPLANLASYACASLARWLSGGPSPLSRWAARFPSLAAGLASIGLMYAIARRYASHAPALLASVCLALSSKHIGYSISMRGYAFQGCGVLCMTYCFLRGMEGDRARWWAGYAVAATLAAWSHPWALLAMAGHGVYLILAAPPRARKWLGWAPAAQGSTTRAGLASMAAATAAFAVLFAPMWSGLAGVVRSETAHRQVYWPTVRWAIATNLAWDQPHAWDLARFGMAAVVACGVLRGALRTPLGGVAACMVATVFAILEAHPPGWFGTRYLLFLAPTCHLLLAACLQVMPRAAGWAGRDARSPYLPRPLGDAAVIVASGAVAAGLIAVAYAGFVGDGTARGVPCIAWPESGAVLFGVVALQARITSTTRPLVLAVGAVDGLYLATSLAGAAWESPLREAAEAALVAAIVGLSFAAPQDTPARTVADGRPPPDPGAEAAPLTRDWQG